MKQIKFKEITFLEVLEMVEDGQEIYNRKIHNDQGEFKPITHVHNFSMLRLDEISDYEWFVEEVDHE